MDVVRVAPADMPDRVLRSLRLADVGVDAFSVEALSCSLRRAASFLCPTTPRSLVRAVEDALRSVPGFTAETSDTLDTIVDNLVSYGDLVEMSALETSVVGRQLFLAAPAFVRRASGACVLLGVRPDGVELLGDELADRIDYEAHARYLPWSEEHGALLASTDLIEHTSSRWLRTPRSVPPGELVELFVQRLEAAGPSGEIVAPRILDPGSNVTYYRGRWRAPREVDDGRFVARIPQRFGADLWCFAVLRQGQVDRLVPLPLRADIGPAADEAWRLQAAIDAVEGHPQLIRLRAGPDAAVTIVDLFGPLPSWAQRHLDIAGIPRLRGRGALFSYSVPTLEVAEEVAFLAELLWLEVRDETERITT